MIKDLLKGLSIRPVSYYKVYKEVAGSTVAGIMLSQLIYWFTATNKDVIWKIDEDWIDELDLSEGEIRSGKSKLKLLNFLEIKAVGSPAKTHYKIDWDLLAVAVENGTISMAKKKEQREVKKREKADKRASKTQDISVPLNSQNQSVPMDEPSSVDLTEPVPLNSQNQSSDINETLYKAKKKEENTTEKEENSENLHYRCDISIEKREEQKENLRCRYDISVKKVVDYMNSVFKTNYKNNNKHVKEILKQGFTLEEMMIVIDKKYKQWFNTDSEQYLRPSTIFGDKFEEYLNAETKEQRIKTDKFVDNLFKKFEGAVKVIENKSLEIKDLINLKSNSNQIFSNEELSILGNYSSMSELLSLFMQRELKLSLKEKSRYVYK